MSLLGRWNCEYYLRAGHFLLSLLPLVGRVLTLPGAKPGFTVCFEPWQQLEFERLMSLYWWSKERQWLRGWCLLFARWWWVCAHPVIPLFFLNLALCSELSSSGLNSQSMGTEFTFQPARQHQKVLVLLKRTKQSGKDLTTQWIMISKCLVSVQIWKSKIHLKWASNDHGLEWGMWSHNRRGNQG